MAKQDHVVVAEVIKPHGLRGELVLQCYAESPELFDEVPWIRLAPAQGPRGKARRFEIETWRTHKGRVLVKFKGVEGRDQAETWRGFLVSVSADLLPEPEDGEVYLHAILGCEVATEDGKPLGVLEQFSEHGGQEVWSIVTPDGREILLPARPEFVTDIDVEAKRITVAPPPGLLDIYLSQDESS
jgi:16S rRNA processing protein RimM